MVSLSFPGRLLTIDPMYESFMVKPKWESVLSFSIGAKVFAAG